jgi:hypothetical protein
MNCDLKRPMDCKYKRRPLPNLFSSACLALLFLLAGRSTVRAAGAQGVPALPAGFGPQFAIADFNGDHRPDLACVRGGQSTSATGSYWIDLWLSSTERQSIRLVAPSGGLLIEARDVNGDHIVDLVLSTAWFRQPVAILLNDGHGTFSPAEASAFPGAFHRAGDIWRSTPTHGMEALGTRAQWQDGICLEAQELLYPQSSIGSIRALRSTILISPLLISHAGRAPPFIRRHL